ncbi:protease complex subunit PrcB family protein [Hydrogenibacillus sp. N12]|uniref:protease complex subunit PrcB family protein n=1 Tax=Hydrogenibacillus sp. N12 TaxID=2866627 RepID=UPI001C7D02B8|nr:protease complex subunit PrcB family protein [Hydrogenibacillus sp. N12]QZA33591.1 protease complex subunit PrcB family protein [Hydrogenibacillus sp. N12]
MRTDRFDVSAPMPRTRLDAAARRSPEPAPASPDAPRSRRAYAAVGPPGGKPRFALFVLLALAIGALLLRFEGARPATAAAAFLATLPERKAAADAAAARLRDDGWIRGDGAAGLALDRPIRYGEAAVVLARFFPEPRRAVWPETPIEGRYLNVRKEAWYRSALAVLADAGVFFDLRANFEAPIPYGELIIVLARTASALHLIDPNAPIASEPTAPSPASPPVSERPKPLPIPEPEGPRRSDAEAELALTALRALGVIEDGDARALGFEAPPAEGRRDDAATRSEERRRPPLWTAPVERRLAFLWIDRLRDVARLHAPANSDPSAERPGGSDPVAEEEWSVPVTVHETRLHPEVKRVVLSADLPNPGYRLTVLRVEFSDGGRRAAIVYRIEAPEPGRFYPQVITRREAVAYVPADAAVVAVPERSVPPKPPGVSPPERPPSGDLIERRGKTRLLQGAG